VSHDRELLRALTTKVWVLHDRHITEFPGGFAEWEEVSAERKHAASVRAKEEESLRKVHERKKIAKQKDSAAPTTRDAERKQRAAQRDLEMAEQEIASLEARTESLTKSLEDPELYTRPTGVEEAKRLGEELERVKRALEAAFQKWSEATESVES
jgi:ATP-binding cassette subfamily F protein 3